MKEVIYKPNDEGLMTVLSISDPIETDGSKSDTHLDSGIYSAWIDGDYELPDEVEGKRREIYYSEQHNKIIAKFVDLSIDDLPIEMQAQVSREAAYGLQLLHGYISESDIPEPFRIGAIKQSDVFKSKKKK